MGGRGIEDAYRTGRGSITMRAVVEVEEDNRGRNALVVTELPYQVNPDNLAQKIADLVDNGKLARASPTSATSSSARTGHATGRSCSSATRSRKVVLNNLYKHTQLQDTFGANMLALVDGVPRTLPLDRSSGTGSTHQIEVISAAHPLPAAQGRGARAHPAWRCSRRSTRSTRSSR